MNPVTNHTLYADIKAILTEARQSAYRAVNFTMVMAYWEIGKRIVEQEQGGKERAGYGETLLKELSVQLTRDFGKGFTETNLKYFRQFYLTYPPLEKSHAVRDESQKLSQHPLRSELGWTHYRLLLKVENEAARAWYLNEAVAGHWSTRALERQINSFYYERLLSSRQKEPVLAEAKAETAKLAPQPEDFIKDPYVLEFLNLSKDNHFREKDLEEAIIQNLQQFLLELGKGYAFVARQKYIRAGDDFYIDLVFYNYILKCFVLIDLKLGKLTHQDIGQMDTYVRWYEDREKQEGDNPTLGIILCSEKNETIVKYSILKESRQLFASQYKLYLPTEQELAREVEEGMIHYQLQQAK